MDAATDPWEQDTTQAPLAPESVRPRRPIGEIFVELGFITWAQLEDALVVQQRTGARLGEVLIDLGSLSRLDLASALAEHWESGQSAAAAIGQPPQNGQRVAPHTEPGWAADDRNAIAEFELRLRAAEDRLESEPPGRQRSSRWRRSGTEEDGASQARVDETAERLADVGKLEGAVANLGQSIARLSAARAGDALAIGARLAQLEAAIESPDDREPRDGEGVHSGLAAQSDALAARLEQAERRLHGLAALEAQVGALEAAAALQARVGVVPVTAADAGVTAPPHAELGSLERRVRRIEESLAASGDLAELKAAVVELERRLGVQVAIAEEQARVSERAVRKGLASLGKRLIGPEQKYRGEGKGLRRSIERLGAAVVEADARMAKQISVSEAEGYVAFAPTAVGYRLVEIPGTPPEIGSSLEVDGCQGQVVVVRYGRSPFPFDSRPCAYLERA